MNSTNPVPLKEDTPAETPVPKRGDELELTIEDWGDKGRGVAHAGRMVVMTDRGVPGDRVRARIWGRRKRHLQADILEIIEPSPHRVEAACRHFGTCGGCRLQELTYDQQVKDKVRHVTEQVRRIGKIESLPDPVVVPCDPDYRYRNKMEFSFGGETGAGLQLGLHPRNNYRDVFDLKECWLTDERAGMIVNTLRSFFSEGGEEPYHPVRHTGFLRFVVVRFGVNTGDVLINLVTADHPWPRAEEFGSYLRKTCPWMTTALWTVNSSRANVANGELRTIYFGPGSLTERLGPFTFEIAPTGFFQTNTNQAQRLFSQVVEWADPTEAGEILDLYSGAGAISLFLSQRASRVTGVEMHADSVTAARRNAERNNVTNCEFIAADALEYLRERATAHAIFPTVVVDPPRAGLHPKAIRTLVDVGVPRIVYVSCNPAAFGRDLEMMGSAYRLTKLAAVDMFPHTPHIEVIALLERTDNPS